MAKTVNVDMQDDETLVKIAKMQGVITISGEYHVSGTGVSDWKSQSFIPADFTAAERTTLQNAFNLVVAKCRTAEGV